MDSRCDAARPDPVLRRRIFRAVMLTKRSGVAAATPEWLWTRSGRGRRPMGCASVSDVRQACAGVGVCQPTRGTLWRPYGKPIFTSESITLIKPGRDRLWSRIDIRTPRSCLLGSRATWWSSGSIVRGLAVHRRALGWRGRGSPAGIIRRNRRGRLTEAESDRYAVESTWERTGRTFFQS